MFHIGGNSVARAILQYHHNAITLNVANKWRRCGAKSCGNAMCQDYVQDMASPYVAKPPGGHKLPHGNATPATWRQRGICPHISTWCRRGNGTCSQRVLNISWPLAFVHTFPRVVDMVMARVPNEFSTYRGHRHFMCYRHDPIPYCSP